MSLIDPSLFSGPRPDDESAGTPFAMFPMPSQLRPRRQDYRDPRPLTRWTTVVLYLEIALVLAILAYQFVVGATLSFDPDRQRQVNLTITVGSYGFAFIRGFMCLRWMWRANKNARAISSGIETTPGWAWGYFFIPILNLFRPFMAMSEIWRSAKSPHGWRNQQIGLLLPAWWGLWIVSGLLSVLSGAMAKAGVADTSGLLIVISLAGYMVVNVLFMQIIHRVARRQVAAIEDDVFD